MTTTLTREDLKLGGQYTAVDNGDDTFDIKNVAVFAEVPAGVKRNKDHIGRDWQEAAILKNKSREKEGHLPPVHVYHTDEHVVKPIYAGKLRLKFTKQVIYQGEKIWATFGDILGMPKEVFSKVKKGFLPYRSVEIHNWENPEIDSLALMDTDVPYFRMEMLTIGDVVKRFRKDHELFIGRPQPAVALRVAEAGSMAVLFKFVTKGADDKVAKDPDMDEPEQEDKSKSKGVFDQAQKTDKGSPGSEADGETPAEETADPLAQSMVEDAQDESGTSPMEAEQAPAWAQQMLSMMKEFLERLAPAPPTQDPLEPVSGFEDTRQETNLEDSAMADQNKPATPAPAPITMKAEDLAALVEGAALKAIAPLQQELATLKAKNAEIEKKTAAKAKFDAVMVGMGRRNIDEGAKKTMLRMAELGMDEDLKQIADSLKVSVPEDPASDADEFESDLASGASGEAGLPAGDEVSAKFCSSNPGPDAVRFVKEERVKFNAWKKAAGSVSDMTFQEWLDSNWRAKKMFHTNKV